MDRGAGTAGRTGPSPGCGHDALLHDSVQVLAAGAAPFLLEGLAAGEAAVVAAGSRTATVLREAAGHSPLLQVVDPAEVYGRRTAGAITALRRLAARSSAEGASRVRVVGEVDFGRTERERLEWQRYEAALGQVLAGWPLWILCVFDTRLLAEEVVDSTLRTHSALVTGDGRRPNPSYVDPADFLRGLPVPAEPLEQTRPALAADDVHELVGLRRAVAAALGGVDGPQDLLEDFLLAVDEMTSNAVRHGKPPVDLRLWTSADRVVCTISDGGTGFDDPFAGYGPAHGEDLSRGGMGLWLARQLCDHVDVTRQDGGVTIRLTTHLG